MGWIFKNCIFLFFFYWVFKKIVWFPKKKGMLQSENKRLLLEDFTGYFRGLVTYCAAFISHNCLVAFFVWILFWGLEICCFGDLSFCWGMFWLLTKYCMWKVIFNVCVHYTGANPSLLFFSFQGIYKYLERSFSDFKQRGFVVGYDTRGQVTSNCSSKKYEYWLRLQD